MNYNKKGKVLVTGACGFLGKRLVKKLLNTDWEVVAFDLKDLSKEIAHDSLRSVVGNLTDPAFLRDTLKQVDAVFHLAAFIPPNYDDSMFADKCLNINGLGTLRLAEEVLKFPKVRFILFSAGCVYRYSESRVSEEEAIYPTGKAIYYSMSKLVGEYYVEQLREYYQLSATTLRLASCYGPGMPDKSALASFVRCAINGTPIHVWQGGATKYDFVYIDDIVNAALAVLEHCCSGVYNIGSGSSYSILELAHMVRDAYEDKNVAISIKPVEGTVFQGFPALSVEKARQAWGYKPTPLAEGLARYRNEIEDKRRS